MVATSKHTSDRLKNVSCRAEYPQVPYKMTNLLAMGTNQGVVYIGSRL
jgi:hypothetical protein